MRGWDAWPLCLSCLTKGGQRPQALLRTLPGLTAHSTCSTRRGELQGCARMAPHGPTGATGVAALAREPEHGEPLGIAMVEPHGLA